MAFKMKYDVIKDYLPTGTKRRPGGKLSKIRFIVAHDTGNPGSTAKGNINYYRNSLTVAASAQLFVDDNEIRECVPALLEAPERCYHVLYGVEMDNKRWGDDANDCAIGVELCWGKGIDSEEAYKRYVWTLAYLCYKFKLDPACDIIGHDTLDPKRKIDPTNALRYMGKTFARLLVDVQNELKECGNVTAVASAVSTPKVTSPKLGETHTVKVGETLWGISQAYGTTVAKLKVLNPELNVLALQVGTVLVIDPTAETPTPKPTKADVYPELAEFLKHPPIRPYPGKPVKRGDRGKDVEAIQRSLKLSVDGIFGAKTEQAVKDYQSKYKFLDVDGCVGVNTWNVMF